MTAMHAWILGAALSVIVSSAVLLATPAAGAAFFGTKCESYRYNAGGTPPTIYRTTIYARRVSCKKADAIIKDFQRMGRDVLVHRGGSLNSTYWTLKTYPGWQCAMGAGGGACTHRNQIAQYLFA